ncbi:TlpA family protein disulfide reductase [Arenimonas sp. MALMAid1274]|uniref:TlpA family protein disulfide reductase n=1 Tax=Arenimonas sp. MALMAid1274 TaxID=3411630 RepID=UPI003BA2D387
MTRQGVLTWVAIIVLGATSAVLGAWLAKRVLLPPENPPPPGLVVVAPGQALPELQLPDLRDGQAHRLSGPGPVRLVNYWASWCGPCREEMPVLDAFAAQRPSHGVEVVGIALDTPEDARAFLAQVPVSFTLLVETPGPRDSSVQLGNARGVLPFTALVDAQGRLVKTHYGAFADVAQVQDWALD